MATKKSQNESDKAPITLNLLQPRATEKTYREQTKRTYAFFVKLSDSKQEIKKRVEKDYNVTVTDVRVLTRKGKKTKFSKGKHAYPGVTFRRDRKLAYVTLKEGNSIRVFEEEPKAEETKADKKADKKAGAKVSKASAKETKKAGKENN